MTTRRCDATSLVMAALFACAAGMCVVPGCGDESDDPASPAADNTDPLHTDATPSNAGGVSTGATGGAGLAADTDAHASIPGIDVIASDPAVQQAIRAAAERVAQQRDSAVAWGELGMTLLAHEHTAGAATALAEAQRRAPGEARWPYLRGLALLGNVPDTDAAIAHITEAVRRAPADAVMRLKLADLLLAEGDAEPARSHYEAALQLDALDDVGNARAHAGLGEIAHRREDWATARSHLQASVDAMRGIRATHTLLAEVCFRLGDAAAAQRHQALAERLPANFNWPDAHRAAASAFRRGMKAQVDEARRLADRDQLTEAIQLLERTTAAYPDDMPPRLYWARFLLRADRFAEAAVVLKAATERWPDAFEPWYTLGFAYQRWEKPAEAAPCYAKAAELEPGFADAFARWGEALFHLNERDQAAAAFRQALRLDPNLARSHMRLGQIAAGIQDWSAALIHLRRAEQLAPNDRAIKQLIDIVTRQSNE